MSAPKTRNAWSFLSKVESTYGTNSSPTAGTDGVLLDEIPDVSDMQQYLNDGARGNTPAGAPRQRVGQSGRFGGMRVGAAFIGSGAAYSASVFPHLHPLLRACGFDAAGSFGGGAEKWTYTPETGPAGLDSVTAQAYLRGQLYELTGAYSNLEISSEGPAVPRFDFDLLGIASLPTDAAIPTITSYPPITRQPPKSETMGFTLGTFTGGIIRSWRFNLNREHDAARADQNGGVSTSHRGFTPGARNPMLTVVLEAVTLATGAPFHTSTTLNPYQLMELGTMLVCSKNIGSVQYNRWKIFAGSPASAAQAQIVKVTEADDGPTAAWELEIEFKPSAYGVNDEVAIVAD